MVEHFETELKIRHYGCFTDGINKKFQLCIECFNMQFIKGDAIDMMVVRGDPTSFDGFVEYLKKHDKVNNISVLERTDSEIYLRSESSSNGKGKTISEIVFGNGCHYLKPVVYEDGCEVWTIGSDSKDRLNTVIKEIGKIGDVRIIRVKQSRFRDFLTKQERKAIIMAKMMGYYQWPRKANVVDIASRLGIKKTALLSALRHAESKIICKYI